MNINDNPEVAATEELGYQASDLSIAQLVGQVYEVAPPSVQGRLLELLLRPLGVLSLVAIANGIFAKIRFRSGWPELHVQLDDASKVRPTDVIALVEHVQLLSVEAVDSLAQLLASSPVMTGSAAAVLLVTVLVARARTRRVTDSEPAPSCAVWT